MNDLKELLSTIAIWLILGMVGTGMIWKEGQYLNGEKKVELTRNWVVIGAIAGPVSLIGGTLMIFPTVIKFIIEDDKCIANCRTAVENFKEESNR